jgi:hypothetical protein
MLAACFQSLQLSMYGARLKIRYSKLSTNLVASTAGNFKSP